MLATNAIDEISKLKEQIAQLTGEAIGELNSRRSALQEELKTIDAELENLIGRPTKVRRPRRTATKIAIPNGSTGSSPAPTSGKKPDLQELKALLAEAPEKTISLRKEGYDLRNVRILAEANPHLLRMGGKGAWPEVTLLK